LHFLGKFSKSTELFANAHIEHSRGSVFLFTSRTWESAVKNVSVSRSWPPLPTTSFNYIKQLKTILTAVDYTELEPVDPDSRVNWKSSDRCAPCRHADRSVKWQTIYRIFSNLIRTLFTVLEG